VTRHEKLAKNRSWLRVLDLRVVWSYKTGESLTV